MNEIRVLFFATLRDRAGMRETSIDLPERTPVRDLKLLLAERFPNLKEHIPNALIAVNHEYAFDEDPVPLGAEVALFPPVSGG
jgi:molybdopterin synthase catalytic subunit